MPSKMFVNLPVKDLTASKAFFEAAGFAFDPQFTDDKAACMVVGGSNHAMLLTAEVAANTVSHAGRAAVHGG